MKVCDMTKEELKDTINNCIVDMTMVYIIGISVGLIILFIVKLWI